MSEASSEADPVDLLVDEFLDRYRRGQRPSLTEFARGHPEHAERIRSLVPAMLALEVYGPETEAAPRLGGFATSGRLPHRLGDYVLVRTIGSGGMGVVYEAIQESLGRRVALKTIPSRQPGDATRLERFRREALAAARLQHAHIVPVLGIGEHDGLHFYTMQFIDGHGLDLVLREVDRLRRDPDAATEVDAESGGGSLSTGLASGLRDGRFLPGSGPAEATAQQAGAPGPRAARPAPHRQLGARYIESVAWLGVQVAEALDYAHRQGVLHRDIKPSNLLLDARGHVWVTDFGLAKSLDDDELTRTGDVVGTLRYMAPERFRGWSDPRSDVFALGATLYELLAFRPAFDEPDRIRLVDRLMHGGPTPLRQIDRRFPRDLETIVLKALANSAGERYATAGLMAEDLRRFLAGRPVLARRSSGIERTWRWCRRNPAGAAAAVVVAAALANTVAMSLIYAKRQGRSVRVVKALANDLARERESLKASLAESRRILAMRDFDRAQAAFEKDQLGPGLLWMMECWRSAVDAGDPAWRHVALANVSEWSARLPRLRVLLSHEGPVNGAAFSPDGATILTVGEDSAARLWEAESARPVGRPWPHPGAVHSVAFSPDGTTALTGGGDGLARLWDVRRGRPIGSPLPHPGEVRCVAFSPDARTVVIGGSNGTARLWDAASGRPIGAPLVTWGAIACVAFHPDGESVVTASRDGTARLWRASDGTPIGTPLHHPNEVLSVAFSPDGRTLLTGNWGGHVQAWDVATGRRVGEMSKVHQGHVRAIAFSPDGKCYVTGSEDRTARLRDAATHAPLGPPLVHQGPVVAVAFRADGRDLLTASSDQTVRVWDAESCRHPVPVLTKPSAGKAVAFHPDGHGFFAVGFHGAARLWDIRTGRPRGGEIGLEGGDASVACGPGGKSLLLCGNPARLWDTDTDRPIGHPLTHPGGADVVAFHPDGRCVATGGADRTTRVWDARTGEPLGAPVSHAGSVDSLAFSPDGTSLVAGLDAGTARVWDVATGKVVGPALRHPGAVSAVAFSPDGQTLVTGCEDGMARLWNPQTGDLRIRPLPHRAWVFAVAFSPDGRTILTGSRDSMAQLWDAATGQPIGPPFRHPSQVWNVRFAPDGKSVLTADTTGTARVFRLAEAFPDDPERAALRMEVLTGLRLDATRGSLQMLDNATWRETRDCLRSSGSPTMTGAGPELRSRAAEPRRPQ